MTAQLDANSVRNALFEGATPFFQPIHFEKDGSVGYEALGRIVVGGVLLSPGDFMHHIEGTQFIAAFDEYIATRAIMKLAERFNGKLAPFEMPDLHLNVSAYTLAEQGYCEAVIAALESTGMLPERITVEVTEPGSFWEHEGCLRSLERLREIGVQIAIDDFPAWHDPEGLLAWITQRSIAVEVLKLDRSLVRKACDHDELSELVRYVNIAHEYGIIVVAEGIESSADVLVMQICGVDAFQGYHFGKPM